MVSCVFVKSGVRLSSAFVVPGGVGGVEVVPPFGVYIYEVAF